MENQGIYAPTEPHEAPKEPKPPTTGPAMSRRGFLGAIGTIIAAAATGVLTNGCSKKDERETGEQAEKMIQLLKTRSEDEKNKNLCPDLDFGRAERALRAAPEKLWSVNEMEKNGHEPTVYFADETGFDIGTRTEEIPQSTRNCVYDEKAAEPLRRRLPNLRSAVKSAEDMGLDLMAAEQEEHITKNTGPYYERGWSFYKTPEDIRKAGDALFGRRRGNVLGVGQVSADYPYRDRGWRGTLRVNYAD